MHWPAQPGVLDGNAAGIHALHEDEVGAQHVAGVRAQLAQKPGYPLLQWSLAGLVGAASIVPCFVKIGVFLAAKQGGQSLLERWPALTAGIQSEKIDSPRSNGVVAAVKKRAALVQLLLQDAGGNFRNVVFCYCLGWHWVPLLWGGENLNGSFVWYPTKKLSSDALFQHRRLRKPKTVGRLALKTTWSLLISRQRIVLLILLTGAPHEKTEN